MKKTVSCLFFLSVTVFFLSLSIKNDVFAEEILLEKKSDASETEKKAETLLKVQQVIEEISRLGSSKQSDFSVENEEKDLSDLNEKKTEKKAQVQAAPASKNSKLSAPFISDEDWLSVPDGLTPTQVRSAYSETKQVWKDNYEREQFVVSLILKLPEEYHQYFMPMIADSLYFSVKTHTMPQVKKYRGKKPTRVAPELKEFVEQGFLDDLPPALYYAVMPEAWPSYYMSLASELPPKKHYTPQEVTEFLIENGKKTAPVSALKMAEKASGFPQLKGKPLTQKEMVSVLSVMQSLKEKALDVAYKQMRRDLNRYVMENKDKIFEMFISPCQAMSTAFVKTGHEDFLSAQVASAGLSVSEFSEKCDRMFTAARVAGLSSLKGAEIGRIRREYSSLPKEAVIQKKTYEMILKMHTAPKQDVDAVRPFRRRILDTFQEQANSSSFWKIPFSSK